MTDTPKPVGWQFYQGGKWWNGDDRIKDHRKNTEEAGIPTRDVFALTGEYHADCGHLLAEVAELRAQAGQQKLAMDAACGELTMFLTLLRNITQSHKHGSLQEADEAIVAAENYLSSDGAEPNACAHKWVDARNDHVQSGELCINCLAVRAGNLPSDRYQKRIQEVERALGNAGSETDVTIASGAAGLLASIAARASSRKTVFTQEGLTYAEEELGDWQITVEKIG